MPRGQTHKLPCLQGHWGGRIVAVRGQNLLPWNFLSLKGAVVIMTCHDYSGAQYLLEMFYFRIYLLLA